ncbi:btk-binding protein-related [Anaeramoeba flamelloides]|uniref:Btk-binding protein-related n=1 Tax=Anaeramoeba flamelloides TaxID=1746091 RepID=A0ABQ8XMF4_9EUKA|nr:btk-binding protein-related [Anaeramoeba flamelloides]
MSEHSTLNKDVSEESSENSQPVSKQLGIKQQFGSDSYSPDSSDETFGNLNFSKSSNSSHNSIEMITGYNCNLDESESVSFDQRKNNTSKRSYSDASTFSDSENTSSCIHYSESEDEKTELKITDGMQKKFIDFLVSFKGSTEDYFKNKFTKNMKKYFFDFSYVLDKVTNCGKFNRQIFDINNQLFKSIVHFVIGENNKQNEKEDLIYYLYHNIYLEIEEGKEFLLKNHQGGLYGVCNFCGTTRIENAHQVRKIVSNCVKDAIYDFGEYPTSCLVWKGRNQLEIYQKHTQKRSRKFTIENEIIKDIQSGERTFLILTHSGAIYSLAEQTENNNNTFYEIPFKDPENSNWGELREVTFFKKNNIKIDSIAMCSRQNYFLTPNGKLFANGENDEGTLGDGSYISKSLPVLIYENVSMVFGGVGASHFFFTTTNNELYGCGLNKCGQLGIGNYINQSSPMQVSDFSAGAIRDIHCGGYHSVLIATGRKSYSCGSGDFNGFKDENYENIDRFTQVPLLKNELVQKISGGKTFVFIQTISNEFYGWNFDEYNQPVSDHYSWKYPRKITIPSYLITNPDFSCGTNGIYLFSSFLQKKKIANKLFLTYKEFYKSKKYSDSELLFSNIFEVQVHKLIIEFRTKLKINAIQKIINENNFRKRHINTFLKWVYYNKNTENFLIDLKKIFTAMQLQYPPDENSLEKDLLSLYNNQDSKDFAILVKRKRRKKKNVNRNNNRKPKNNKKKKKNRNRNEREEKKKEKEKEKEKKKENEKEKEKEKNIKDNDEEEYEKIPVHKLILLIRSGLFQELFQNLNENENKNENENENENEKNFNNIKDYTGKSKESYQLLIKYLYTNKIDLMDLNFNHEDKEIFLQKIQNSKYNPQKTKLKFKFLIGELQELIKYYKINEGSELIKQLRNIKNSIFSNFEK